MGKCLLESNLVTAQCGSGSFSALGKVIIGNHPAPTFSPRVWLMGGTFWACHIGGFLLSM